MKSKRFYSSSPLPENDHQLDPDFPDDFEDDFIEGENDEIGGSSVRISHGFTEAARASIIAEIKEARKQRRSSPGTFGKKAE